MKMSQRAIKYSLRAHGATSQIIPISTAACSITTTSVMKDKPGFWIKPILALLIPTIVNYHVQRENPTAWPAQTQHTSTAPALMNASTQTWSVTESLSARTRKMKTTGDADRNSWKMEDLREKPASSVRVFSIQMSRSLLSLAMVFLNVKMELMSPGSVQIPTSSCSGFSQSAWHCWWLS